MKNQFDRGGPVGEMLDHARDLYGDLAQQLLASISALQAKPSSKEALQRCEYLARRCQDHLNVVLKMEADLVRKSDTVSDRIVGHEFDLDAAREEIRERIARLSAAGTDE